MTWIACQLQADIGDVVHHTVSWSKDFGGTTRCGIVFRWADATKEKSYEMLLDLANCVPAKRFRGDATCFACIAEEDESGVNV